jgi:hypothetical protein
VRNRGRRNRPLVEVSAAGSNPVFRSNRTPGQGEIIGDTRPPARLGRSPQHSPLQTCPHHFGGARTKVPSSPTRSSIDRVGSSSSVVASHSIIVLIKGARSEGSTIPWPRRMWSSRRNTSPSLTSFRLASVTGLMSDSSCAPNSSRLSCQWRNQLTDSYNHLYVDSVTASGLDRQKEELGKIERVARRPGGGTRIQWKSCWPP